MKTKIKFPKFPDRLRSRKLWLAVVAALVVFGNNAYDWGLDEKEVLAIVGSLLSFVLVEGARDVKAA